MPLKKIIVAIDEINKNKFNHILCSLDPEMCMVKIGSVSFNAFGRDSINEAANYGFKIFLDLKLHDIPNTVKKSIETLIDLPISMLTVHASGGKKMLEEAVAVTRNSNIKVFGVTALTSLSDNDAYTIFKRPAAEQVLAMIELAKQSNIDGVVCSPHELKIVKEHSELLTITPGIRLDKIKDDQVRAMSPQDAIKNGSDYLVIGRPITTSNNIKNSLKEIYDSIQ